MAIANGLVLPVSLAEAASTPRQRRSATALALMLLLVGSLSWVTVGRPLPAISGPSFFTAYDALSAVIAWATAFLLISQFEQTRSLHLLAVAMTFAFAGTLAAAHMLTVPGLLLREPLFGTDNTTLWIRVVWLSALPLGALKYLAARQPRLQAFCRVGEPRPMAAAGMMMAFALGVIAVIIATTARSILPDLTPKPQNFANTYYVVLPAVVGLQVFALGTLWRHDRGRTALGLWLSVALLAVLVETVIGWVLLGVLPDRRYSLNFYIARIVGLISGSIVFLALLAQVGRCYRELADAGDKLQSRVRELSASDAQLIAIVSSTSEAVLTKSLDGTITSWNPAAERLLGYTSGEMVGRSVRTIVPPSRQKEENDILARIASGERVESYDTERLDKQGKPIEVSITASPLRVDGRLIGASSIMHDVSARKQRERHNALLLREVNHRSKNVLAVVQAIARQTANGSAPEKFLAAFSDRIGALAASHDLLVESEWKGVDLEALVRAELGRFKELIGSRITITGPALRLSPHAAQTIGMTMHELATNAGKYGALSNETGRIEVCWQLVERDGDRRVRLTWSERGGPPVSLPSHKGFGTMLIHDVPAKSLSAEVEVRYETTGVVWSLDAPSHTVIDDSAAPINGGWPDHTGRRREGLDGVGQTGT